jgi:16S rRNA (adenine1518-N6/adenine1519-N6)-dimethyltransferase
VTHRANRLAGRAGSAEAFTPKRELGQHFLVDENILGVIDRLAQLSARDVVLEVGAGLGVLTRYLADCVRHVHAVEIDRSLQPALSQALAGTANADLLFGDALALDLSRLVPQPSKLVANLPYSIATPLCVESLHRLPSLERWCVMLQREVADRFVAAPRTKAYGAVSVLVQLTCDRGGLHPVARTCFRPQPNVDSALLALVRKRVWGADYAWLKTVVQAAFLHRRKTLANGLALGGVASRSRAEEALRELGHGPATRAEHLYPEELEQIAEILR